MYYNLACAVINRACVDWVKGRDIFASYNPTTKAQYYTLRDWWLNVRTAYNFFMKDNIYWDYTDYNRQVFIERLGITKEERRKYEELFEHKRRNYYLCYEQRQVNDNKGIRRKHISR